MSRLDRGPTVCGGVTDHHLNHHHPLAPPADVMKQVFESPGWEAVLREKKNKLELKSNSNVYCVRSRGRSEESR